jgi:opacity protein-like surface antigen
MLGSPWNTVPGSVSFLGDRGGITYGAGLEVLSVHGFGLKLEYRFVDLGNDSFKFTNPAMVSAVGSDTNIHQVLLSANFKFNGPN